MISKMLNEVGPQECPSALDQRVLSKAPKLFIVYFKVRDSFMGGCEEFHQAEKDIHHLVKA